jgi:hypothetical protein
MSGVLINGDICVEAVSEMATFIKLYTSHCGLTFTL